MGHIFTRYVRHRLIVPVGLGSLCMLLALAACTTTTTVPVHHPPTSSTSNGAPTLSTQPPEPSPTAAGVATFSCATGSLPVTSRSTRTSCTAQSANGMATVHATYTFTGPGSLADEDQLIGAGWMIAGLVNADGAGFSGTWYLYLHQGAWITWGHQKTARWASGRVCP